MLMNIKGTQTGHPFMSLVDDLIGSGQLMVTEIAFNNPSCCIGKHRSLVIIAVGMQ